MSAGLGISSSADRLPETEAAEATQQQADQYDRKYRARVTQLPLYQWWKHPGVSVSAGFNGFGIDVAEAVRDRINVRVGGEFAKYTGSFDEGNADVKANVRVGGGHAGIDLFLFQHSTFHISPQVRFGILTRGLITVAIPPGVPVSFNGKDYSSTTTDPLRGSAYLDTRKIAPGLTVGWGNIVPRSRPKHWTFPVDLGFYYIGQPNLQIAFTGTACTTNTNGTSGCDTVSQDPQFQQNLQKVIQRERHNVSYASLFPALSFGVGYRF